jgi:trigger factor
MNVTVEDVSPVEKKLAIELEWPRVQKQLDDAYRELGRGVNLHGFRKGKVPRSMLERMYGRQVEQEVKQRLVQESFLLAAQKHSLSPVADPIVEDMELLPNKSFRFSARVEVRAEFEPVDYIGVELEKEAPEVSEAEVDAALLAKQRDFTEWKRIEGRGTLQAGDTVYVDIDGQVGPHPVKREAVPVDVGAPDGEAEALPGLSAALVGQPVEAKDVVLSFAVPAELPAEGVPAERRDIAGQAAQVKVTVREARQKLVPALDDDFAKDTGEADTLAGLRDKLRDKVAADKDRAEAQKLRGELVKKLLEKNPFQVAPALVERQAEQMVHRAKLQAAMRGVDLRSVNLDEDKLKEDLRPQAVEEVRALFLLDAVATREKVEVTDADLEKRLVEMSKERGKNAQRLKAELQKEGKLDSVRHQIREEKTLDLLISRANITVKR